MNGNTVLAMTEEMRAWNNVLQVNWIMPRHKFSERFAKRIAKTTQRNDKHNNEMNAEWVLEVERN